MEAFTFRERQIPKLGFGTWELTGPEAVASVEHALEVGYRHIDTAQAYDNQAQVGRAMEASGVDRSAIFLTTKVWMENYEPDQLADSVARSLEELRTDYVDLLLLHWPNPDVPMEDTLEALAQTHAEGHAALVGVSNFTTRLLDRAVRRCPVPLAVNQVEYHPYLDQSPVMKRLERHGMGLTAYSPLRRGTLMDDSLLNRIGERRGKSAAQVALRWLIQQPRVMAIPKAASPEHAKANLDIFDFELSDSEMDEIAGLSRPDGRTIDPEWAPEWDRAA